MAEPMPVTSETLETRPVTETDEMRMETDDHATEIPVPDPPSRCATYSSSTVDSTQNLRETWIYSGTREKRQTSKRVARSK